MAKTTKGDKVKYDINFEESVTKMKSTKQIYRYTGSLTTPPCTEGVKWHVLSDPTYTITIDHLRQLQGLIKFSARDTQPLYDPYDMDWPVKRKSDYIF
jgi:carbonic anhydrase